MTGADDDERAAEVIGRCRERMERGELVDVEAVAREHPDLARRLRQLLGGLRRVDRAYAPSHAGAGARPDLAGRLVGPYHLVRELGSGGMGTVFLASVARRDGGEENGSSRVALKLIHPHLSAQPSFLERFVREGQIGLRIRHPNVVATLDVGTAEVDGRSVHFLAMEHVEGQTLRALLAELGRVPEELCRHVGREVAKALAAIHAAGAVHRDLKPENVLITTDHVVKVMDLGVARLVDDAAPLSQTGAFVGSLRYGAPEQFLHRDAAGARRFIDHRADLHALGLTLYELATGAHPFEADEVGAVVRRVLDERPRRAGEVNPQLSPLFEELLAQLLEKDRSLRPNTADDVAQILEEGEESMWWRERSLAIRAATHQPLRRIRIPRETALYGRDAELAKLRALFGAAKSGDGQIVLVEGEAGIGKSRLVDEFVGLLAQSGEDVNFLYGSYPPGGAATASGAFTSAYREHFGDDESAVRAALPQTPLLAPAFAALLRGDAAPAGAVPLTKDSLQTVFVHATRSFAAQRTTIVLIDDLHFAPEEGRALFASLALAVPGHRILLVGTTRPEIDAAWVAQIDRGEHVSRIRPPRLGAKDLVLLLRDSLRSEHLAEELAAKIAVKSDGNPFFVFEILRGLRDGQFLTRKPDGTWATTKFIAEIEVPGTVKDLIFARVGSLTTEARNLLDIAACAGFEFDPVLVGEVLHVGRIPVLQRLAAVEKSHRLVRSVGRRFAFDHHQVAEVLYAGLPEMLREDYHAAIAAALEAKSDAASKKPTDLDGALCVDLAEHFLKGAQGQRASRYLDAALDHLEKGYLNDVAVRLADRALAVPGRVAGRERCVLLLRKADRLDLLGRRDAQRAALEEAVTLADANGDAALRARALRSLGILHWRLARHDEARAVLGEALATARAAGDRKEEAAATGKLGGVFWSLGRFAEAREHFERDLALSREIGDREGEARATGNLGTVFCLLGHLGEGREHHERFLALAREIGDREGEATATGNLGNVFWSLGRLGEGREHHERFLALAREIGDRQGEARATGTWGIDSWRLGRLGEAREHFERYVAVSREIGDRWNEGFALQCLADLSADEGDAAAAERRCAEALALRREIGHRNGEAETLVARGAHLARQGREAEARADLDAALALARELSLPGFELLATAHLATLLGGHVAAALATLAAHEGDAEMQDAMEARFLLWQATLDPAHLAEAKRLLEFIVEHAPPDCRESMLANVRLHREIAAAAREEGLPLAADSSRGGDERSAGSADA